MPARRFGNVRKLPSGRYQARYLGPDGSFRLGPVTYETSDEARLWLAEQEVARSRGGAVDPRKGKITLSTYAGDWLEVRIDLSDRTRELYGSLLRRHILPSLGHVEIADIDLDTIKKWRAKLHRDGVGSVTVAKAYRLLRTIMGSAVEDGRIAANPCRIKGAGVEQTPEREIASVPEVYALADAIEPRFRALVLLAAFGGLRFGELAALTRRAVDLEAATVTVSAAAAELADGSRVIKSPKSRASRRTVSLPPQVARELRIHLGRYVGASDDSLVFSGPKGAPIRRGNFHKVWSTAREKAGMPETFHFHDLRHTGNVLAASTGASTADLMARMGHGSARAALIYQHATKDADRLIAAGIGKTITRAKRAR